MPATSAPITVAATGRLLSPIVPLLSAAAGQPWSVTVGNYSTAILTVETIPGHSGEIIPTLSQATYSGHSGPIRFGLKGSLPPGAPATSGGGYVILTWRAGPEVKTVTGLVGLSPTIISLGPGSSVTVTGGPIEIANVAGSVLATGVLVGSLLASTTETVGSTGSVTFLAPLGGVDWSSLIIVVTVVGTPTGIPACISTITPRYVAPLTPIGTKKYQAIIPAPAPGALSSYALTLYWSTANTASITVGVHGSTGPAPTLTRTDGRLNPAGIYSNTGQTTGTALHTIITAPRSPLRIMLYTLDLCAEGPTGIVGVVGTIAGSTTTLSRGRTASINFPNGLLLDPARPLLLDPIVHTGANQFVSATYDLVV